ncbi:MAG: peptidoglycan bridge formation glycyltransferase FemA/FemB family protein [Anaerolineae bacterium]|nr:peptidoglycan bridge formation glycyltransferase FemA/FemB family protein [Anaerolineae bacterium]
MEILDRNAWDAFIGEHPDAHILQTGAWGDLKARFGWRPVRVRHGQCGAQVLVKPMPLGLSFAYIPKGPLGTGWDALLAGLVEYCRDQGIQFLKVEPDAWEGASVEIPAPTPALVRNAAAVQPRGTVVVDLAAGETDVLSRMKQKTRYNIRLAEKKGVVVELSDDLDVFYSLMLTTGQRDQFGVHAQAYYRSVYELFPRHQAQLFIARHQGEPLAGIMVFRNGSRAWYFYGASSNDSRNLMPTYLLQWEAMRWCLRLGCRSYDLWGVPDESEQVLERDFLARSDGLWGVYRFKRGFGGQVMRAYPAFDLVLGSWRYNIYRLYRKIARMDA